MFKKRGQVWIETVIYTLIGLTIMGILLSVIVPRINQINDKSLILQSINVLNKIDEQISGSLIASGNSRQIDLTFKKGEYWINPLEDSITFVLSETGLKYSEPGQTTKQGEVSILTLEKNKQYSIYLSLSYDYLNLTYDFGEQNKTLSSSPVGYKLVAENKGKINAPASNLTNINLKVL